MTGVQTCALPISLASRQPVAFIQVEVETLTQLREALDAGVNMVLLDNMELPVLREAVGLWLDESLLTGESLPIAKHADPLPAVTPLADRRNLVFSGTQVVAGRGSAVVTATGRHSELGRIAGLVETTPDPPTPLETRIAAFGRHIQLCPPQGFGLQNLLRGPHMLGCL